MLVGLNDDDDDGEEEPAECCHDKRRARVLATLHRAHATGRLSELAATAAEGLGTIEAGAWWPNPKEVDAEELAFDGRLNAWMVDYQAATVDLPKALIQQIDDFIGRWRDRSTFFVFSATKAKLILDAEADFNKFRDQVAGYGHTSSIGAATVTVDGKEVRADQIPPGSSTIDRVEAIIKWGAIFVGSAAALKIASDLGVFARLGRLVGGGGAGGGGPMIGGVRRYGSAKLGG